MMPYRSISSHRGCPDPQVIDLAARLGFTDVCFQTEGNQEAMLAELRDRLDRSRLVDRIRGHGMTMSLWIHEFEDLDPTWGPLALDNHVLWQALRERYQHWVADRFPEVDWWVLTVVESTVRCTDPALLERLVLLLREVCQSAGKRVMIRSFVWTLDEFAGVREAIARLPDDVVVMTKYVAQDWHRGHGLGGEPVHDPLIGKVGAKDQIIELDLAGEYFRGNALAHCFAEELHRRFAFWRQHGIDGISVRIDRGWRPWLHHDNILHEVQESNLWCLGRWAAGVTDDLDTPLREWAADRFGAAVADEITAIARCCDRVVQEALTVCGEPFGDTRRPQPAMRSLLPPGEAPATIDQPAKADNHGDPFCRWLACWRWDPNLIARYNLLRRGDPALAAQKAAGQVAALARANEALQRLDRISSLLDPEAAIFLRFRLEENRHHLILMGEAAQAWLATLRVPHCPPDELPALHALIDNHLVAMLAEWQAHCHESAVAIWPAGRTRQLKRCEYLDVPQFCRELRRYARIHVSDAKRESP